MVTSSKEHNRTVITLLPNRSASWAQTRLFLFLICGTTLAVGLLWAFAGAWAVLPFSGLEAALVAWLMYSVCRRTYQRQVITLGTDKVIVQFGERFPRRSWELLRADTHLTVTQPRHHLDPLTLQIFDRQHSIELGDFLNKEDKDKALSMLRSAGLFVKGFGAESSRLL